AVAGRADEDHLVTEERLEGDGTLTLRRADDAELELAAGDHLDDGLRVEDREHDGQLRVAALELTEQKRQDVPGRAGGGADLEPPGQRPLLLAGHLLDD